MKKQILWAICALGMLFSITSCERDGIYSPEKRISKIYRDEGDGLKLYQTWFWEGKRLQSIVCPFNGGNNISEFRYNKHKQLDTILMKACKFFSDRSDTVTKGCMVFYYDNNGKHLDSFDIFVGKTFSTKTAHYEFAYQSGKLSGYQLERYYSYKNYENQIDESVLQLFFPELFGLELNPRSIRAENDKGIDFVERYSASFTYHDENIVKCVLTRLVSPKQKETYDYTFTNFKNPFLSMYQGGNPESVSTHNRNLVKSYHLSAVDIEDPDFPIEYVDCDYRYDILDGYPTQRIEEQKLYWGNLENYFEGDIPDVDTTYTTRIFRYEYLQ